MLLDCVPTLIKVAHKVISERALEIANNSQGILPERNVLVVTREPADDKISCCVNG
jgi:hypothetical protein